MRTREKNCLSWWFPKIEAAGLRVPQTEIVRTDLPLIEILDGKPPMGYGEFIAELRQAVERIGLPCFLRTGQGSGKHQFDRCCNLRKVEYPAQHVSNLVDWSCTVDFFGLPTNVWVAREFLPVKALAVLPRYGNMPAVQEWRLFVRDGKVECQHPYWPKDALGQGMRCTAGVERLFKGLSRSSPKIGAECTRLAEAAGRAVEGGYWSVDVLRTRKGLLYVTDMAIGESSFHWPDCPNCIIERPDQRATEKAPKLRRRNKAAST